jgi:hypothetical protein
MIKSFNDQLESESLFLPSIALHFSTFLAIKFLLLLGSIPPPSKIVLNSTISSKQNEQPSGYSRLRIPLLGKKACGGAPKQARIITCIVLIARNLCPPSFSYLFLRIPDYLTLNTQMEFRTSTAKVSTTAELERQ